MVVFVHGVPETHHLWRGIREALGRKDTIAVACPGFGNPRPTRFAATKEAYVDWLVAELEKIGEPSTSSATTGAALSQCVSRRFVPTSSVHG